MHQSLQPQKKNLKCSTRSRLIELKTREYVYKTLKQCAQLNLTSETTPHGRLAANDLNPTERH